MEKKYLILVILFLIMAASSIARACRAMFRIGAAIELKRLGYKFEKVNLN